MKDGLLERWIDSPFMVRSNNVVLLLSVEDFLLNCGTR